MSSTIPTSMRAQSYTRNGVASDVLELSDSYRVPIPHVSEVLIEVHASALNPVDYQFMAGGLVNLVTSKPFVPGFDIAGVIVSVGSKVEKFKVGDRVYAMNSFQKCGGLAEYATVNESLLAIIPPNLAFPEAAAVPLAALTAWQGLVDYAHVKEGSKVYVKGGSGGVGTFVVQIAKLFGAEVTASCSERNAELVRSLGADRVIDYTKEDPIKVFTQNEFDIVFDCVGGTELYEASKTFMSRKGVYVSIVGDVAGRLSGWGGLLAQVSSVVARKIKAAAGVDVAYHNFTAWSNGKQLAEIGEAIEKGKIKPIIDSKHTLEEAAKAFERQQSGRARGKIIVLVKGA